MVIGDYPGKVVCANRAAGQPLRKPKIKKEGQDNMKTGLLRKARVMLPILLALVLATGGLVGMASGADGAAKYKTYNLTLNSEKSTAENLFSMNDGAAMTTTATSSGGFQMLVDAKGKFVIPASTFKIASKMSIGVDTELKLAKDVKGQIGKGGNIQAVLDAKKLKVKVKKTKDPGVVTFAAPVISTTLGGDWVAISLR